MFLLPSHHHQYVTLVDGLAFADANLFDGAVDGRGEVVFHFHGFEDDDGLAARDGRADFKGDANDEAGHGCADSGFPAAMRRRGCPCERARAFVFNLDFEPLAREKDFIGLALALVRPVEAAGEDFVGFSVDDEAIATPGFVYACTCLCRGGQRRDLAPVDIDGRAVDGDGALWRVFAGFDGMAVAVGAGNIGHAAFLFVRIPGIRVLLRLLYHACGSYVQRKRLQRLALLRTLQASLRILTLL